MINLPAIAQRTQEPIHEVEIVAKNRELRLFKIGSVTATPQIITVVKRLLPLYGIADAKEEHILDVAIFISSYKLIAVNEINLAFEKFAKQELNIDDHKLYGKVDLAAIGRILTAYINWRQKVYHEIDMDNEKLQERIKEKEREQKAYEDFYKNFPEMLKNFKGESYNDVPAYWYDACLNAGYIQFADGEKRAIWEEAKQIAAKIKQQPKNYVEFKNNLQSAVETSDNQAKVIAQKLCVYKKVLNR